MSPFPHRYVVELSDGQLAASPRAPIDVGAPPQFGGSEYVWSPEELLAGAALTCLWTTFSAYARRAGVTNIGWSGTAIAVLDRGRPPVMTSIALVIDLRVPADQVGAAAHALSDAERDCIVARSLIVPVTVRPTIRAREATIAADALC